MGRRWLANRFIGNLRTGVLLVGDIVMICVFVLVGRMHHGADLQGALSTISQFATGWLIAGVLVGAYSERALTTRKSALVVTVIGWSFGTGIAHGIRVLLSPQNGIVPSFLLVSLVVGGALLVGWRTIAQHLLRNNN